MDIPAAVRNKARHVDALEWLDALPQIVADLERAWDVVVGRVYPDATEAFVAEAVTRAGERCVLKILMPRHAVAEDHEIRVLRLAGGNGCVALLAHDESHNALLLERLGPSMYDVGIPVRQRHEILCDVASRVWRPATGLDLPTGAEKGRWLIDYITVTWDDLDRPCSEAAVAHAISCAERRITAHDDERARLVHGDVHQWNTLQAGDGWKLVDPDGLLADPEYDLGVIMREDPEDLMQHGPHERAHRLAGLTGTDPVAIWEWGAVERVSTGLLGTVVDLQPVARRMLAAADVVATLPPP